MFAVARFGIRGGCSTRASAATARLSSTFGKPVPGGQRRGDRTRAATSWWGASPRTGRPAAAGRWRASGPTAYWTGASAATGRSRPTRAPTDEQIEDLRHHPRRPHRGGGLLRRWGDPPLRDRAVLRIGRQLDRSFGHKGINLIDVTKGSDIAYGMARQPDGNSSMVGYAPTTGAATGAWSRSARKGAWTRRSGRGDGSSRLSGPPTSTPTAWRYRPTARSWWWAGPSRGSADFCVVRFKPGGSLDQTFGGEGKAFTDFFGGDDTARGVALQSNGKIVVAGEATSKGVRRMAVARYLAK